MPKRRRLRLLTPMKKKFNNVKVNTTPTQRDGINEVSTPRGRLKGALLDALDPVGEESDTPLEQTPLKRERNISQERRDRRESSGDDENTPRRRSLHRQSYVLKLFDRSVDLSQFEDDSPLYPICRAWITNQPKADYSRFGKKYEHLVHTEDSVDLPGPDGPVISRIPGLIPEQQIRNKDNINLNYREAPPPSREELLQAHITRWNAVKQAWLDQSAKVEERYEETQQLLNRINVNAL